MQRRTGKGAAHIAPPLPPSRMGSGLSEKPTSRLGQKSFGVTNRIWLILVLFLALILFTRSILPYDSASSPRHRLLYTDSKPRNYLNISDSSTTPPFSFCPALGPGDELASKYDPVVLTKTRLHTGSGARIQRVITRALSGHPVTISVIGGSSECYLQIAPASVLLAVFLFVALYSAVRPLCYTKTIPGYTTKARGLRKVTLPLSF